MNLRKQSSTLVQTLIAAGMLAVLAAACGGGSSAGRSYTVSAGVGEVIEITLNTGDMTYGYSVKQTSYAASGVAAGQSNSGTLLKLNADGSYILGPSNDGFILSGKVLPLQNGLLGGHAELSLFGSAASLPLVGVSPPVSTLAAVAGTYNYQGFDCSAQGIPNALGSPACISQVGTITISSAGAFTMCRGGDINTSPGANACVSTVTGSLNAASATPGIFDFLNSSRQHTGWLFAFSAANGQTLAVIDRDDGISHVYGQTVLMTYASAVAGASNGTYLVENNESAEQVVTVARAQLATTAAPGAAGTLVLNSPWPGQNAFQLSASGVIVSSGVAMTSGGVFTYTSKVDPAVYGVGVRYRP